MKNKRKKEEKKWKKVGNKEECVKDLHGKTAIWKRTNPAIHNDFQCFRF